MSDMNFASLSPSLLARKGGAKPAMRRQSPIISGAVTNAHPHQPDVSTNGATSLPANVPESALEDLGWNDLGETPEPAVQAVPDNANDAGEDSEIEGGDERGEHTPDEAFARLGRHAHSSASEPSVVSENVTPIRQGAPRLPRPRLAASRPTEPTGTSPGEASGKRTAFTLRLDPERHLKLRLASTLAGRSAQSLVTEAVDAMFAQTPELDSLIARVKARTRQEG